MTTLADEGWRINLCCCTDVIKNEVKLGIARKHVALTYAMAIKSEAEGADKPDWRAINQAIIDRWGYKGLDALKTRAFGILKGKIDPTK